jgi:capsular exopolysaccharide synthesis family protein
MWRHKSLFLLGLGFCLLAGGLNYAQATRIYQSRTQILVVQKRQDRVTAPENRGQQVDDYVTTHQTLIQSPIIVEYAIQKRNLGALSCFANRAPEVSLTEMIIANLNVSRERSTTASTANILNLRYQSTDPDDCVEVLNAIVESYEFFLVDTYQNVSSEAVRLITSGKTLLEKTLADLHKEYRKFRIESPVLRQGNNSLTPGSQGLAKLEAERSALMVRMVAISSFLGALDGSHAKGDQAVVQAMVAEWSRKLLPDNSTDSRATMQEQLFPLLMTEQRLLESKGPKHPDVIAAREQIAAARTFLTTPLSGISGQSAPSGQGTKFDVAKATRSFLEEQLEYLKVQEKELDNRYKKEFVEAQKFSVYELDDENYRNTITQNRLLYEAIVKRLSEVDLVKNMGAYQSRTIAPPQAGKKVKPSGMVILPLSLLAGLLLGSSLAFLANHLDRSFHSVDEVRQKLGTAIIGLVPNIKPTPEGSRVAGAITMDSHLVTIHRPKSVEAEAFRGIRTSIYFGNPTANCKVIQMTSANGGDGKSTLISNLAVTIAQSGKRVILIDADLRKPRIHKIFGLGSDVGLSSVIAQEADLLKATHENVVPGLDILPCGPIPFNPAEMLTAPRFAELLDLCRDRYDVVLVDTPPILIVSDPSAVAPRVDGVILAIRMRKGNRVPAMRAKNAIDALGVNLLGLVVNAASDGASNGYGYGYGYGYSEAESYHSEEEPLAIEKYEVDTSKNGVLERS